MKNFILRGMVIILILFLIGVYSLPVIISILTWNPIWLFLYAVWWLPVVLSTVAAKLAVEILLDLM